MLPARVRSVLTADGASGVPIKRKIRTLWHALLRTFRGARASFAPITTIPLLAQLRCTTGQQQYCFTSKPRCATQSHLTHHSVEVVTRISINRDDVRGCALCAEGL